jgi:hypothetical protein
MGQVDVYHKHVNSIIVRYMSENIRIVFRNVKEKQMCSMIILEFVFRFYYGSGNENRKMPIGKFRSSVLDQKRASQSNVSENRFSMSVNEELVLEKDNKMLKHRFQTLENLDKAEHKSKFLFNPIVKLPSMGFDKSKTGENLSKVSSRPNNCSLLVYSNTWNLSNYLLSPEKNQLWLDEVHNSDVIAIGVQNADLSNVRTTLLSIFDFPLYHFIGYSSSSRVL